MQTAFNAGELSPFLEGRWDLPQRGRGCREMLNWMPMVEGPAMLRPGTEYRGRVRESTDRTWLLRFVRGPRDCYVLEISDFKIRFWRDGLLLAVSGIPIEVLTPWPVADLVSVDGTCALSTAQSGDQVWIVHRSGRYPPYILQRMALATFTLTRFEPTGGPWADENRGPVTLYTSTEAGATMVLTASTGIWTAQHVGMLVRLRSRDGLDRRPWEAVRTYTLNDVRWSDGHAYRAIEIGSESGSVKPIHTRGVQSDKGSANGGAKWEYLHSGYGVVRITSILTATQALAVPVAEYPGATPRVPAEVVGLANATARWQFGAWSEIGGWPTAVAFAFGRLWMARGRRIWSSRTDDFFNWSDLTAGQILADDGLSALLNGDRINETRWLLEHDKGLLVGADGGVFVLGKSNQSQVMGAVTDGTRNIEWRQQTATGSMSLEPERIASKIAMVDANRRSVKMLGYDIQADGMALSDVTVLADHMMRSGVVWTAWQGGIDRTLWVGLGSGDMAALLFVGEQEVAAWSLHRIQAGKVESGTTVPRPDGDGDDLWVIVQRIVGGNIIRSVERLGKRWSFGDDVKYKVFLDSSVSTREAGGLQLAGLDHLEGLTVTVMRDGVEEVEQAVEGGLVSAEHPAAFSIIAGLKYEGRLRPLLPRPPGSSMKPKQRAPRVTVVVQDTHNVLVSVATQPGQASALRSAGLDSLEPLDDGAIEMVIPSEHQRLPDILLTATGPYPANVLAIEPHWEALAA